MVDLARLLDVSKVTIRSDLDELETGLLVRTHGGAVTVEKQGSSDSFLKPSMKFTAQKTAIAKLAASFVKSGQSIIMTMEVRHCI